MWQRHIVDARAFLWTSAEILDFAHGLGLRPDSSDRILDLGCGWGSLGLALASTHPRLKVLGLDLDTSLVATARDVARAAGLHRRAQFVAEDVQDLNNWVDERPAAVVCQALLVHMPRSGEWLAEVASRLTPGTPLGAVEVDPVAHALGLRDSVTDPDASYRQLRVDVTEAVVRGARSLGVSRRIGSQLADVLLGAGFTDVQSKPMRPQPIHDATWLGRRLRRRLDEGGDPVERHLAAAGGLSAEQYEEWIERQRDADRRRLTALQRGDYQRCECGGAFMAWGRV